MPSTQSNKPIYAVIGATGATGSQVLTQLLSRDTSSLDINVYVRSKSKLISKFPDIENRQNVSLFIGSMTAESLAPCLKNASIILNTIGINSPSPTMSLAQDTAKTIITALRTNAKDTNHTRQTPTMVYLSSISLNEVAHNDGPQFAKKLVYNGLWYIYEDMRHAIAYYRSEGVATGLLHLTCACPGALIQGSESADKSQGRGVQLSLKEYSSMVTYSELGRGMIEMAEKQDQWQDKEVLLISAQPEDFRELATLIFTNIIPGWIIFLVP